MAKSWNEVVLENFGSIIRIIDELKKKKDLSDEEKSAVQLRLDEIRRNMREAIEHRDELKPKLRVAVHDINNTMMGLNYVDLYLEGGIDKKGLDLARDAVSNILDEVKNDFYPKLIAVNKEIEHEVNRARVRYPHITITYESKPVLAKVDRYLLRAVVRNLIANSVQNMVENRTLMSSIRIKLLDKGNHFEIVHEDTGTGVTNGFDIFAGKSGRGGTGTGGQLIKHIVEDLHGGKVHFENLPIGGLRVVVRIPKHILEPKAKPRKANRSRRRVR